ncbi:MAG: FecR family protein [Cyclobacteriaceae bacterium]
MNRDIMEELISKYIQKNLTSEEELVLERWLKEDSVNRKVFENIVGEMTFSQSEIEEVKSRVFRNITSYEPKVELKPSRRNISFINMLRVAAALMAFGILGYLVAEEVLSIGDLKRKENIALLEKKTTYGQKLTFSLPDGTLVKLNAGSKLIYPESFGVNTRNVELEGEAFFDVTRDTKHPFVINTKEIAVQVLGTSFEVSSYPDNAEKQVAVRSGKVMVKEKSNNNEITLIKNEKVGLNLGNRSFTKVEITNQVAEFGWMDRQLAFSDDEFDTIIKILERWYNVEFEISEPIRSTNQTFTGIYNNPSLKEALESISYGYEFKYEIDGKNVRLY